MHGGMTLKLIPLVIASLSLSGLAQAADLRIGSSADYPPWESVDASDQVIGFDRDIGDELCKRINATCVWQNQGFDGLLPALQVGKFDMVISAVSINKERAEKVDFSVPYADAPNSIVVPKGSAAATAKSAEELLDLLKSSSIGVQTGTTHEQVVRAHFPGAQVRTYDRTDDIAEDLAAGRLDAGLMERSSWEPLVKAHGAELVFAGPLLTSSDFSEFGEGQGIALKKGSGELKSKLDAAITSMRADGTIAKASQKWFGYDASKK